MKQVFEACGAHRCRKLCMALVLNGEHSYFPRGTDVFLKIVDEEDVAGSFAQTFSGMTVNGQIGFGEAESVREGVVVEVLEPVEAGKDAGFHRIANVGEDAGLVPRFLQ